MGVHRRPRPEPPRGRSTTGTHTTARRAGEIRLTPTNLFDSSAQVLSLVLLGLGTHRIDAAPPGVFVLCYFIDLHPYQPLHTQPLVLLLLTVSGEAHRTSSLWNGTQDFQHSGIFNLYMTKASCCSKGLWEIT